MSLPASLRSASCRITLALLLFGMTPPGLAMDKDELKARLALIEGWRLAPIALADYCEDIDPEGIHLREQNYATWKAQHAKLTSTVRTTFERLIPLLMPEEGATPQALEDLRGRIMMDVLNALFYAKSEAGMRSVCRHYIGSPTSQNIVPVQQSLEVIEKWRARSATPPAPRPEQKPPDSP